MAGIEGSNPAPAGVKVSRAFRLVGEPFKRKCLRGNNKEERNSRWGCNDGIGFTVTALVQICV